MICFSANQHDKQPLPQRREDLCLESVPLFIYLPHGAQDDLFQDLGEGNAV